MPNSSFEEFLKTREQAAKAYVRGDGGKLDALVAHEGDASFLGPGGDAVVGAEKVAARYRKDAQAFQPDGTTHLEMIQQGHDGDVGFWTGFQIATAQIGDMPRPAEMRLRVTELFRRIDGAWRLIHRHADMAKSPPE